MLRAGRRNHFHATALLPIPPMATTHNTRLPTGRVAHSVNNPSSVRRPTNATLITEALSVAAFGAVYYAVEEVVAAGDSDWLRLLGLGAAGIAWYAVRAFLRSLIAVEGEGDDRVVTLAAGG